MSEQRYGHRICGHCGGPMALTAALSPDRVLAWRWVCQDCSRVVEAPAHPGRPRPFPEREDERGG